MSLRHIGIYTDFNIFSSFSFIHFSSFLFFFSAFLGTCMPNVCCCPFCYRFTFLSSYIFYFPLPSYISCLFVLLPIHVLLLFFLVFSLLSAGLFFPLSNSFPLSCAVMFSSISFYIQQFAFSVWVIPKCLNKPSAYQTIPKLPDNGFPSRRLHGN